MKKRILITGGAGFIGSHLVRLFVNKYPAYHIYNLDKLTYAGNLENLSDLEKASNYTFIKGDICDTKHLKTVFKDHKITDVVHLAAESHVDRSILNPIEFVQTNVLGTVSLLNVAKGFWAENFDEHLFYHVSTDEVYGSLAQGEYFTEETAYDPRSPYSASKASSDQFVRAYGNTYGLSYVISNCSNNYGPYQFPEKLLPLFIANILEGKALPVYGKGENVRDWLWVEDHCSAIDSIFHTGSRHETYNIGGHNEWKNIDLIHLLCEIMDQKMDKASGTAEKLITYVTDRPGHDHRYAIDASKISKELKWEPSLTFEEGLEKTVGWYLANSDWTERVRSGKYMAYYEQQYGKRLIEKE